MIPTAHHYYFLIKYRRQKTKVGSRKTEGGSQKPKLIPNINVLVFP